MWQIYRGPDPTSRQKMPPGRAGSHECLRPRSRTRPSRATWGMNAAQSYLINVVVPTVNLLRTLSNSQMERTRRFVPRHAARGTPIMTVTIAVAIVCGLGLSGCGSQTTTPTPTAPASTTPAPASNVLLLDNFAQDAALNGSLWVVPQGAGTFLPRTQIRPPSQPPQIANGVLRLRLDTFNQTALTPGDSFWGSEIDSVQAFSVGTGLSFKASVRLEGPVPGGMVGSLFGYALSSGGSTRDEIDFELLTQMPSGVLTNVYEAGGFSSPGIPVFVSRGGATDLHMYEVDWYSDHVVWLVDGQQVREITSGVPTQAMTVRLNFWAPDESFSQAFNGSLTPVSSAQQDQTFFYDVASVEVDRLAGSAPSSTARGRALPAGGRTGGGR